MAYCTADSMRMLGNDFFSRSATLTLKLLAFVSATDVIGGMASTIFASISTKPPVCVTSCP